MTSNPFDDNYVDPSYPSEDINSDVMDDPDDHPTFDGPDEDIIPDEDTPMPHVQWMCSGVQASTLKRKAKEGHMLPPSSKPDQPTTDTKGRYMEGGCPECGCRTIWKKVTL